MPGRIDQNLNRHKIIFTEIAFYITAAHVFNIYILTSSNKSETAGHCCDPALSVLVMLVSRNVFHVVSALQSFAFICITCRRLVLWRLQCYVLLVPKNKCLFRKSLQPDLEA